MRYSKVKEGRFILRQNRFVAKVLIDGKEETVHVKNTGRCRELLLPDTKVYLSLSDNPTRKTRYDLIAVEKRSENNEPILINMDSAAPNEVVSEWLPVSGIFPDGTAFRQEVTSGLSRFDFCAEFEGVTSFIEVKGVTLESDGRVYFPDAPTQRGVKHLKELSELSLKGSENYVIFVVQMKGAKSFSPNRKTHPQFGEALDEAIRSGVNILAGDCTVTPDTMVIDGFVPVVP